MKILVCDDLPEKRSDFEDAIKDAGQPNIDIERLFGDKLKQRLNTLIASADAALADAEGSYELPTTEFNDVDLIILDNNLAHLGIEGARLTAESIAGYIRAFTSASYIVSINKNPDIDFDLRYLIGDYATRTDLALNSHHLSNPALWTRERSKAVNGFLPWYWPKLLDAGADRRKKVEFVRDRLLGSVVEALGFSTDTFNLLSRQARSLLSLAEETRDTTTEQREPHGSTATFREVFLASARSLPNKEERTLLDLKLENGVDGVDAIISRVVAADIDLWFRRDVLGPQETLVDVPHLLMRMPFLLGDNANEIEYWNMAVDSAEKGPPHGLDQALFSTHVAEARFGGDVWAPSACFWWSELRDNDDLGAHFSAETNLSWADAVFCEDRSEFILTTECSGTSMPVEFVAQFEGSWNRRYVADIEDVRYVPKTRFAQ